MNNRKNQILDASLSLFLEKGFDKTSISDILDRLDIARGTLYYHFESKEAIMDAIIERTGEKIMADLERVSADTERPVYEKLLALFSGMNMKRLSGGSQMIDYLNQPQNALFHEKSNRMIIEKAAPLLGRVLSEGIGENLFQNDFPDETAEIILAAVIGFLDARHGSAGGGDFERRLSALLYNTERMLGAEKEGFGRFREAVLRRQQGDGHER